MYQLPVVYSHVKNTSILLKWTQLVITVYGTYLIFMFLYT